MCEENQDIGIVIDIDGGKYGKTVNYFIPALSRFLRDKGGREPQSTVVRKGRGSSWRPFLTSVLWPSHPPLSLKNLESLAINYFNSLPDCKQMRTSLMCCR